MSSEFVGQSAVVTGGGSGIGLECARQLGRDGAAVVLAGRTESKLVSAVAVLASEGLDAHFAVCDVANETQVRDAINKAVTLAPLGVVVASAGVGHGGPFHQTTLEQWNDVMNTNLTGAFLLFKHASIAMAKRWNNGCDFFDCWSTDASIYDTVLRVEGGLRNAREKYCR